ncbi:zinc finger MYND domain-containing protein 11-like [Daphnia carinata]|uniref:zinc finger MYND domain-containing protein 11-like n=1 Tax=Daphnia carinata TaxID=120202 RepID=UPI0025803936|nr:zinc finger MYND domain-containing protein 11-like [Daphnia carinata]
MARHAQITIWQQLNIHINNTGITESRHRDSVVLGCVIRVYQNFCVHVLFCDINNKTQMEACLPQTKVYRRGDPLTCQRIWDAIKVIKYDRKSATAENISRYCCKNYNLEGKLVKGQLDLLVEDNLIIKKSTAPVKGCNKGVEQTIFAIPLASEIDLTGKNDWYCFYCHKPGEVLACTSCPRVYHIACLNDLKHEDVTEKFVCLLCKEIKCEESKEDSEARGELNLLLSFACARLEEKLPMENYVWNSVNNNAAYNTPFTTDRCAARLTKMPKQVSSSVEEEDKWRAKFLLRLPMMSLPSMNDRADRQVYKSLAQFLMDADTVVHNVTIFHGEHSLLADSARVMKRDCAYELGEINLCRDCYKRSNMQEEPDWFCHPCNPSHELVYAKAKGFPYWPAKVLRIINGREYDVRFFGHGHDRLTLDKSFTRPITCNVTSLVPKRSAAWVKAVDELKKHQAMLAEAALNSSNDEEEYDDDYQHGENGATGKPSVAESPTQNRSHYLKPFSVYLNRLEVPAVVEEIAKLSEPLICGSKLPFSEESVISQDVTAENSLTDLISSIIIEDNPLFSKANDTENEEITVKDFVSSAMSRDGHKLNEECIELLAARERIAVLEKDIESQRQQIQAHKQQIDSQRDEIETQKHDHASMIRSLKEQHAKEIAETKSKIWCSNGCGAEGIYHCCFSVAYCNTICQQLHWKSNHKKSCRRERESKRVK